MTPLETLIKSKVPRLQDWEIKGLADVLTEAGYGLVDDSPLDDVIEYQDTDGPK